MIVRVRFKDGHPLRVQPHQRRELLLTTSAILKPVAASTVALALWRLGSDMGWAGPFFVTEGPLSRWQVWLGLAVGVGYAAIWTGQAARPARVAETAAEDDSISFNTAA